MMLPIDPHADPSRRAWVAFPPCRHGDGCPDCESGRNCFVHWQYLIRNEGPRVFLQGPTYARTGGSRIRHKVTGAPPLRQCCTGNEPNDAYPGVVVPGRFGDRCRHSRFAVAARTMALRQPLWRLSGPSPIVEVSPTNALQRRLVTHTRLDSDDMSRWGRSGRREPPTRADGNNGMTTGAAARAAEAIETTVYR
jgi:hypothetical protein